MTIMTESPRHVVFDAKKLTEAQRDGTACVVCRGQDAAMVPVGVVDGGQVFACGIHRDCPTWCEGSHYVRDGRVTHYAQSIVIGEPARTFVLPLSVIADWPKSTAVPAVMLAGRKRGTVRLERRDARELAEVIESDVGEVAAALRAAVAVLDGTEV